MEFDFDVVVIDGVAERKTSRMLSQALGARLDFHCFVQVVANYCLAFEAASQQDFDVIVLPRRGSIDEFPLTDFVQMVTNLIGFNASIIHTVDHDSAYHVFGKTVRSSASGSDGYVVDDLVAAIESAVKNSPQVAEERELPKATKRSHREIVHATRDLASEQPQHPSKHSRHEQNRHQYSCSADEIAYLQYCAYRQMLAHTQAPEGRHYPHAPSAAITESSAVTISTTSSISTAHSFFVHNTIPHHPRPYSHYHNSPSHRNQPCHLFSFYHPSQYQYQYPYPYATTLHPPSAQGYCAHSRSSDSSVLQHYQDAVVPVTHATHHQQQHQQQRLASSRNCTSDTIAGVREERFLASASVPVVSEYIHGHHPNVSSFTRAVDLPCADNSSEGSCTTRESLDSLSLDDTAVVEMSDFRESYGTDSIDGAEFAACFDVDTWI
eukprot:gene9626-11318_t